MDHALERQLLESLREHVSPRNMGQQYYAVETLVAEIFGGKTGQFNRASRAPDVLITRGESTPIAIELKLVGRAFSKSASNRVADWLAAAVETRRSFHGEITLNAMLLFTHADDEALYDYPNQPLTRTIQRLLRADDGVGYDSVLIGSGRDELRWQWYTVGSNAPGEANQHSTSDVVALLRQSRPTTRTTHEPKPSNRKRRMLLVADEWSSGRGGISTVNRELSIALAASNVEATVMVPSASEDDVNSASDADVALVTPARVPGLSYRESLMLRPVFADVDWEPDFIIGHGRILGPYAAVQQQYFPHARRVHFVHTDAEQLEAAKEEPGGPSHMSTADERRTLENALARSADLVVGLGPLLSETMRDELIGPSAAPPVLCLVPGLRAGFDLSTTPAPVKNRVLMVARAEDMHSKGIDIAAEALLRVVDEWPSTKPHPPSLVVRGVPESAADDVRSKLESILEGRVHYFFRPYSSSEGDLLQDLAQARVLVMPSRHEGFGLSAYEAIAAGVPVLVSAESGLAQFLVESGIDSTPSSIVTTHRRGSRLASDLWAEAIARILNSPENAREEARKLRQRIASVTSWERSVTALLAELDKT